MKELKTILKYIPGFRSGEKINKIVASIYYSFFIILLIVRISLVGLQANDVRAITSALLFPFVILSKIDSLNKHFDKK